MPHNILIIEIFQEPVGFKQNHVKKKKNHNCHLFEMIVKVS